jgi:glutathione synthase/RimK-type ligase-like ATP-grasp enzyme
MKIALVTYNDQGNFPGEGSLEDNRLHQFLEQKGLDTKFEIWNDPAVKWENYDAILLKSPWDYFDRIQEFNQWLDKLEAQKLFVLNPVKTVRWNSDKRYLLDVEKSGSAIVPTVILKSSDDLNLAKLYETWQTENIIVKPVISGGAKNTFSIPKAETAAFEPKIKALLAEEAYLAQPFVPEIQTEGEWSLIYFNGRFSHCVLKVPKSGDFRVQHYFGGAIISSAPPEKVRLAAEKLVKDFAQGCLYARVDGVQTKGEFQLMELELIEPLLYLQENESLYENYYQALLELLKEKGKS